MAFKASCPLTLLISMLKPTSVQNFSQFSQEHISIRILWGPLFLKIQKGTPAGFNFSYLVKKNNNNKSRKILNKMKNILLVINLI